MPKEPMRALRRFVFDGVEKCAVVGSPGSTGDAFEALGEGFPVAQVFDLKHVLPETRGICRVGEQVVVFTHLEGIQSKKRMAFRKQIQVEQKFFCRAFHVTPPAMDSWLL